MKRRFWKLGSLIGITVCTVLFTIYCGGKMNPLTPGGKDDDNIGGGTNELPPEKSTITMTGSLALTTSTSASLKLTDFTGFNIYCMTFAEKPQACKATIGADGSFNENCVGFAGYSFGCFLKQDSTTKASLEFKGEAANGTTLVGGAGKLKFDISFDPQTGMAFAKIDQQESSALSEDAINKALEALGLKKTELPDVTGNWTIECIDDPLTEEEECSGDKGPQNGMSIYLRQFEADTGTKIAVWQNKEKHDLCVADGNEGQPQFFVNFGEKKGVDPNSKEALEENIDQIIASLPTKLKDIIFNAARNRSAEFLKKCDAGQTMFDANKCKLAETSVEEQIFIDPQTGEKKTFYKPHWWQAEEFPTIQDYTGEMKLQEFECYFENPMEGEKMQSCPPQAVSIGDGKGKVTVYSSANDQPIMLVCKDPFNEQNLQQMPAFGANKQDCLAKAKTGAAGGGTGENECKNVTYLGESMKEGVIGEIRRIIIEMITMDDERKDSICQNKVGDITNFKECKTKQNDPVCQMATKLSLFGLKLDAFGKLTSNGQTPQTFPFEFAMAGMCPTIFNPETGGKEVNFNTMKGPCRDEFVGLDFAAQLIVLKNIVMKWRPAAEVIMCGLKEGSADFDILNSGIRNSCLPQIFLDKLCDEYGNCTPTLRCPGSMAKDGMCFDEGIFMGRISGRMAILNLKPKVAGAFELSENTVDQWTEWDDENKKPIPCKSGHSTIINGRMTNDQGTEFLAKFSEHQQESCEGGSSEKENNGGDEMNVSTIKFTKTE